MRSFIPEYITKQIIIFLSLPTEVFYLFSLEMNWIERARERENTQYCKCVNEKLRKFQFEDEIYKFPYWNSEKIGTKFQFQPSYRIRHTFILCRVHSTTYISLHALNVKFSRFFSINFNSYAFGVEICSTIRNIRCMRTKRFCIVLEFKTPSSFAITICEVFFYAHFHVCVLSFISHILFGTFFLSTSFIFRTYESAPLALIFIN